MQELIRCLLHIALKKMPFASFFLEILNSSSGTVPADFFCVDVYLFIDEKGQSARTKI
jgi:hypothetical protein